MVVESELHSKSSDKIMDNISQVSKQPRQVCAADLNKIIPQCNEDTALELISS